MICHKPHDGQGVPEDAPGWLSHNTPSEEGDVMQGKPEESCDSPTAEAEAPEKDGDGQGVYVIHPEGVDDEDDDEIRSMKLQDDAKSVQRRKRSREEKSLQGLLNRNQSYEHRSGLDLSVKRPRTDIGQPADLHNPEKTSALRSKSTSPNMFSEAGVGNSADVKDQMEKYHRLMRLVDQQKPLAQAMEEVGLSFQEFFYLHRLNNQISSGQEQPQAPFLENPKILSAPPTVSTMFDKFAPKEQHIGALPVADEWATSKESHDARIQALLKEANEDVIQQQKKSSEAQQLSSSRLQQQPTTLNPSVTAALMASLASNPDHNSEERQGLLRNLFLKAQGFLSQGSTPNKSMNNSIMSVTNSPSLHDRSASSKNDSITAGTVSSGVGSIKKGTLDPSNFDEDVFDEYIAKFTNLNRCASMTCPYFTRDHYHCVVEDCNYQRFTNKADVIRHYNMHKKRDNSLAHGFLRFSPTEDCSSKYANCHLNGKSTHYHCMQPDCNKVYTSTSDVMTHENFHKKYMQFVCSGFKRFRATEQCDLECCVFRNQKTTHFHCTRDDCNFTFKNKCDIEKHKTYHLRDDAYLSKGFKKFYKNEACGNAECVWNYTANHFHCLRSGCNFSFTSTSQMESHKRKHERNELLSESADNLQGSSAQNSPKMPMFNPALFQEAAKKILASMPAGTVPHGLGLSAAQLPTNRDAQQMDGTLPRAQTGSLSPSTPISSRSYSVGSYQQPDGPKVSVKEELAWKPSYSYADLPQSNGQFSTAAVASLRDSPLTAAKASRSMIEPSRPDWPRSGGVISPSMALSAAAALKSGSSHMDGVGNSANGGASDKPKDTEAMDVDEKQEPQSSTKDGAGMALTAYSQRQKVLKFFVGASADNCWIPNCDFYAKQHFHCLVENCEAMFTTSEKVLKHARFHENLESMGAALPIQSALTKTSLPAIIDAPKAKLEATTSEPPPGYIALQSGLSKSYVSATGYEPIAESRSLSVSPKNKSEIISSSASAKPEALVNPFTLGALSFSQPQTQMPTLASQLYAAALLKGAGTPASSSPIPVTQPLTSTPVSTYKLLQNQASLSALMGHMTQAAASQSAADPACSSSAAIPREIDQNVYLDKASESGYLHFKTGSQCLRHDCKYMHQNHWHCTINRCRYVCKSLGKAQTHRQAHDSLEVYARAAKQCFRSYSVKKKCPNPNCEFRLRGHYHCLKPGCQFSTIGTSKLPWHMKKHEKIARREASGFKYFTKKEQCGHFDCKYNCHFSHYHCIRTGCTFAFQYKHQMSTHVRKHLRRMLGRSYTGDVTDIDHTNVDSGDDSLPLIIDEMDEAEQGPGIRLPEEQLLAQEQERLSKEQLEVLERMTKQMKSSYAALTASQANASEHEMVSNVMDMKGDGGAENENINSDGPSVEYQEALDLSAMAPSFSKPADYMHPRALNSPHEDSNSNGFGNTTDEADANADGDNDDSSRTSHSPPVKTSPIPGPYVAKFKLGEDVMNGFQRFEANENCGDDKCTYMYKVSHYHCTRENCFYRFTGRTHMFKHQQHHDRVAGLVRDDFKRFKASNPCEDEDCEFRGKNTHFHCLRCDFKCTDSAKVGTHRRQHIKADTLEQSGFQRVRGKDDCGRVECKYRCRNMSHFHCLQPGCSYAIVGLTGIELHAEKHKRGLLQTAATAQANSTDLILQNLGVFQNMRRQLLNASMVERPTHNGLDDGTAGHNLSLPALAALQEMRGQVSMKPPSTSPPSSGENGLSNQGSPFLFSTPTDGSPMLSKFPLLGSSSPTRGVVTASPSPVSSTTVTMVAEGVGS